MLAELLGQRAAPVGALVEDRDFVRPRLLEQACDRLHPSLVRSMREQDLLARRARRARRAPSLGRRRAIAVLCQLCAHERRRRELGSDRRALVEAFAAICLLCPVTRLILVLAPLRWRVGRGLLLRQHVRRRLLGLGLLQLHLRRRMLGLRPMCLRMLGPLPGLRLVRLHDRGRLLDVLLGGRGLGRQLEEIRRCVRVVCGERELALQNGEHGDRRLDGVQVAGVLLLPALSVARGLDRPGELARLGGVVVHVRERLRGRLDPLVARRLPALVVAEVADEARALHQSLALPDTLGEQLVGDRHGDFEHRRPIRVPRDRVRGGDRSRRAARTGGRSGRACSA